tara:strand:+ start:109 stop:405 length:297 start_codon:yes stop_codon:yes gene_type:complete
MQLYVVTWKFESSEDQLYSSKAFVDYVDSGKSQNPIDGYERIAWAHTPQDGTGVIICRALNASILFKVFGSWRDKFGMIWEYKPALTTEEFIGLLKEQ